MNQIPDRSQMPERTRETISKYLGDLQALQSHGLDAIARQVEQVQSKGHPEAQSAVMEFKQTLESHIGMLDRRMGELGGSTTSPVKEAASKVAGVVAGLYDKTRTEAISKAVRDDYTFFSHCSVAYLMLHTTAKGLGDEQTASLAERGYRDCARMVIRVDRIMPELVLQELRQDGAQVKDVAADCRRLVHDAWNREAEMTRSGSTGATSGSRGQSGMGSAGGGSMGHTGGAETGPSSGGMSQPGGSGAGSTGQTGPSSGSGGTGGRGGSGSGQGSRS